MHWSLTVDNAARQCPSFSSPHRHDAAAINTALAATRGTDEPTYIGMNPHGLSYAGGQFRRGVFITDGRNFGCDLG